jgi:hypothetical protein
MISAGSIVYVKKVSLGLKRGATSLGFTKPVACVVLGVAENEIKGTEVDRNTMSSLGVFYPEDILDYLGEEKFKEFIKNVEAKYEFDIDVQFTPEANNDLMFTPEGKQ